MLITVTSTRGEDAKRNELDTCLVRRELVNKGREVTQQTTSPTNAELQSRREALPLAQGAPENRAERRRVREGRPAEGGASDKLQWQESKCNRNRNRRQDGGRHGSRSQGEYCSR